MRKNKTLFIVVLLIISMVNGCDNVLKPMDNFDFEGASIKISLKNK